MARPKAPDAHPAPVLRRIAEQQVDQGAFLWLLRERMAAGARVRLDELRPVDRRLASHLDGLALGGRVAWRLCRAPLAHPARGERFLATAVALRLGDARALAACLRAGPPAPELAGALEWAALAPAARASVAELMAALARSPRATHRLAAVVARGRLRWMDGASAALAAALADGDARVWARACRAVGELGADGLCPSAGSSFGIVLDALQNAPPAAPGGAAGWAAWALARLAPSGAARPVLTGGPGRRVNPWLRLALEPAPSPGWVAEPPTESAAWAALAGAAQGERRRAAWALAGAVPGAPLFPVAAPAARQDAWLAAHLTPPRPPAPPRA